MDVWPDIIVTPCGYTKRYLAPRIENRQIHHSHLLGDECLTCYRPGVVHNKALGVLCLVRTAYSTPPDEEAKRPTRRRAERGLEPQQVEGQRELFG